MVKPTKKVENVKVLADTKKVTKKAEAKAASK